MNDKMKRAIEESFPIVEINKLAVPERNAFKPIYQMHKWFARRASCVFRAILLASMKPAGTNIMEEFYKDHTNDPDTNGVTIVDPFMGGGTTVVEALRLGCHVTGIDLNPVAWFIVKCETELVDIEELREAFKRLENRITASGKPLKEELLSHYKTECPCCGAGGEDADIIYTFWVKSAICTNPNCKKEIPLFGDYIICRKSPSIRYVPDYKCSHCGNDIDIDIEPASLIAETNLSVNNTGDSSGELRSNKRWALYNEFTASATCPWCSEENSRLNVKSLSVKKKKVTLTVLFCPHCKSVWQYRGTLPDDVICPACKKSYNPNKGNLPSKGDFLCSSCGTKDKIINSIRKLPEEQLLPIKPYALEGYCSKCAGYSGDDDIFGDKKKEKNTTHSCNVSKNNGKFFKRITSSDLARYNDAVRMWESAKENLPYPKSKISDGQETHRLLEHHYIYWYKMFNPRQLLCLSILLKAIGEEKHQSLKEMLLTSFFNTLNNVSDFASYRQTIGALRQVFARHDYAPKLSPCENNVWGTSVGMGAFSTWVEAVLEGKSFYYEAWDYYKNDNDKKKISNDALKGQHNLLCLSSASMKHNNISCVITDPPYVGNVNYSELADFFYVWLRLILSKTYPHFSPELTPKTDEIVENPTRGKTTEDYEKGLTEVWKNCHATLEDDGIMAFTFHHAEGSAWESLLESICNAGFVIEAIYPIHGESESSLHLMDKQAISYDLIHVCKKRNGSVSIKQRSWAGVRREIRDKAREEIKLIEAGRYGVGVRLPAMDVNIVLIGKCLELYSKHYGSIIDHNSKAVPLQDALTQIRMMVEQLVTTDNPLPSELEHIDPVSYVYLTCLCDRKEINGDEVHKSTRSIIEIDGLIKAGIMGKGRAKRGRTYEIKLPQERYKEIRDLFIKKKKVLKQGLLFPEMEEGRFDDIRLVDILHYLMGLAYSGENLVPWLNDFRQVTPHVRCAFEYLKDKNPAMQEPINKVLSLMDV